MIPKKLTIEGLYSYQERQIIDFSKLTEAGLFGIFGSVGSGKSSILESISFALYGETERLNQRDRRAYNMMNLKSNRFYIEFDFINYENKTFRATREFKRNSKRFEDVKNSSSVFYELKNEDWIPLEHTNAEKILGLSYSNFKRTIIIPQGQFKEFLELGAKERTDMMKDIFQLERFDLQFKTAILSKENQSQLDQLNGKISGFDDVSEELVQEKKQLVEIQENNLENTRKEHDKAELDFQHLKSIKTDFEDLNIKKKEFETLENKKEEFEKKRKEIETFEKIHSVFFSKLNEQKKVEKEVSDFFKNLEIQSKNFKETQSEIEKIQEELRKLNFDFEQLSEKRKEENDLELMVQILNLKKEKNELKKRLDNGLPHLESVLNNQKNLTENIEKSELEIDELNESKIPSELIIEVGTWFSDLKSIQKDIEDEKVRMYDFNNKLNVIKNDFKDRGINLETSENDFKLKIEGFANRKKEFEIQKNNLEVQQKLAHYSDALHDGESCPLCGSFDHPNIAEFSDVSQRLDEINESLKSLNLDQEKAQKEWNEVQAKLSEKKFFENQILELNPKLENLDIQKSEHFQKFKWEEFDAANLEDFELKKRNNSEVEKKILTKSESLKEFRKSLDKENSNFKKFNSKIEEFKIQIAQKESLIEQDLSRLKVLKFSDFEYKESDLLKKEWKILKEKNDKTESDHIRFTQNLNDLNPKLSSQKTSLEITEQRFKTAKKELENITSEINSSLNLHKIESLEFVQKVLDSNLDLPFVRKEIEDFSVKYQTAKNLIEQLTEKLKEVTFDNDDFLQKEEIVNILKIKLKNETETLTREKTVLERLMKDFEMKTDLINQKEKIENRAENLKTLTKLFNGSGFVQYVSSIYLRQLCDFANERFHRMTRNQLSLQLNENHDFEIIDYLNEGLSRSVKTLSGGQSFQVALSLALALAESVQSNAKAEKNFFFIDEGFGTQDAESVNVVFETLMNLQKENRIVGIISHVEELKEKIPLALNITKHEEKGSLIEWING